MTIQELERSLQLNNKKIKKLRDKFDKLDFKYERVKNHLLTFYKDYMEDIKEVEKKHRINKINFEDFLKIKYFMSDIFIMSVLEIFKINNIDKELCEELESMKND